MKIHRLFLSILLSFSMLILRGQPLYVASYNIRYENNEDAKKGNGWKQRCPVICAQLNFEHPDIFGAQEVLHGQLKDMLSQLDGYGYIGTARDDGKKRGEYAPIFYDRSRLRLLNHGQFWISETPDVPSRGWDGACTRICTWGRFEQIQTGVQFLFFNLHLDHVGKTARREGSELVIRKIREIASDEAPVVLTGDFNGDQNDEVYGIFTRTGYFSDCYEHSRLRFAENGTFNSFNQDAKKESRIDHIFISPQFRSDRYAILTNAYWTTDPQSGKAERRLPSDHYPVFVHLML